MSRENGINKCSDNKSTRSDLSFLYLKKSHSVQSVMQYLKQWFTPSHTFLNVLIP